MEKVKHIIVENEWSRWNDTLEREVSGTQYMVVRKGIKLRWINLPILTMIVGLVLSTNSYSYSRLEGIVGAALMFLSLAGGLLILAVCETTLQVCNTKKGAERWMKYMELK